MSNSNIIPFQFESFEIRAVILAGNPMFSARDVAVALGYANPSEAYKDHCKLLKLLSYSESLELGWVNPNPRGEYIMPESDVYRLIVKSNKPEAEQFEKWVFEEVLPQIRKTGSYTAQPHPTELLTAIQLGKEAARMARAFGFKGNMIALSADNLVRQRSGISLLELMGATHLLADTRGMTYTPTQLGEMMDPPQTAQAVNKLLEAANLQKKEMGAWMPTDEALKLSEWLDTNKKHTNGTPIKQIKWFKEVLNRLTLPQPA